MEQERQQIQNKNIDFFAGCCQTHSQNPRLKQYTCHTFDKLLCNSYESTHQKIFIKFKKTNPQKLLRKHYRDKTCDRLYILKWTNDIKKGQQNVNWFYLNVVQILGGGSQSLKSNLKGTALNSNQRVWNFSFKYQPEDLVIVKNFIYFVGGNELVIVNLNNIYQAYYDIKQLTHSMAYNKIQDICGLIENGQPSALFYLRDKQNNIFLRQAIGGNLIPSSWSKTINNWSSKMKNGFNLFNTKNNEKFNNVFFKVLIPKVIGINFYDKKQFYLVNLNTFSEIPNTRQTLQNWQLAVPENTKIALKSLFYNTKQAIKYQSQFDDIIIITIGQKKALQSFKLFLSLKKNVSIHPYSVYEAINILQESIIDWQRSKFQKYTMVNHQLQNIQDLEYVTNGLMLKGYQYPYSILPYYSFYPDQCRDIGTSFNILTNQAFIWNQFLNYNTKNQPKIFQQYYTFFDKEKGLVQLQDLILKRNKFSVPFILKTLYKNKQHNKNIKSLSEADIDLKLLTYQWFKSYKSLKILQIKGQLFLLREHSLSLLTQIDQFQYKFENTSCQQLYKSLSYNENPEKFSKQNRQNQNQHQEQNDQQINRGISRISLQENLNKKSIIFEDTYSYETINQDEIKCVFKKFVLVNMRSLFQLYHKQELIQRKAQDGESQHQQDNDVVYPNFYFELLSHKARDYITFYNNFFKKYSGLFKHQILNNCFELDDTIRQFNKNNMRLFSLFQPFSVIFQFYAYLANQKLKKQHSNYFQDIFTKFIKQSNQLKLYNLLNGRANHDSLTVVSKLLIGLVPFHPQIQFQMNQPINRVFFYNKIMFKKKNSFLQMIYENYQKGFKDISKNIICQFIERLIKHKYYPINTSVLSTAIIISQSKLKQLFFGLIMNFVGSTLQMFNEQISTLPLTSNQIKDPELNNIIKGIFPDFNIMSTQFQTPQKQKKINDALLYGHKTTNFQYPNQDQLTQIILKFDPQKINSKINQLNKKLIDQKQTTKLISFWISVFRFRCYEFNIIVKYKDFFTKQDLIKILDKCKVALQSLKKYFFEIYPYQERFMKNQQPSAHSFNTRQVSNNMSDIIQEVENQDDEQRDEIIDDKQHQKNFDDWFLNSKYVPVKIQLMERLASTRWINLLKKALYEQLNPLSFKGTLINNELCFQEFHNRLGKFLFIKSIKLNSVLLLKRVIEYYGINKIQEWIQEENQIKFDYRKTSFQFKSHLKYSKINCQDNFKDLPQIAAKMNYRNAFIQASAEQIYKERQDNHNYYNNNKRKSYFNTKR